MVNPGDYNEILYKFYTGFPTKPLMNEEEQKDFLKYLKEDSPFASDKRPDRKYTMTYISGIFSTGAYGRSNPFFNDWPHYSSNWVEVLDIFSIIKELGQEDLDLTSKQIGQWNFYEGNIVAAFGGTTLSVHRVIAELAEFINWYNSLGIDPAITKEVRSRESLIE